MVRNIQRELVRENVVLSYSNEPPQMHLAYVEKEIHRLIDCARLAKSEAEPSFGKGSDQALLVKLVPSTQRSLQEEGDSAGCLDANSVASVAEDTLKAKPFAKAVVCRPQESDPPNPRIQEGGSPNARFIINCFGGDSVRNAELGNNRMANDHESNVARDQCGVRKLLSSHAQIEMFEANPEVDVEHAPVTGSTWAEVEVMNKGKAKAVEMQHCESDIKQMLSQLEASMEHLLQQQHQLPQQLQQGPHVLDRNISDLDSMMLSAHAQKTKSKPIGRHSPDITKHAASASMLKFYTKQQH